MGIEKSTPRDFLVTVSGISSPFDKASQVAKKSNARRYRDGGQKDPDILADPPELGDLTVTRAWAHGRDVPVAKTMMNYVGNASKQWTITKQPMRGGQRYGSPIVYTGVLISCTDPEVDSNAGSDPSMLELVFALSKRV